MRTHHWEDDVFDPHKENVLGGKETPYVPDPCWVLETGCRIISTLQTLSAAPVLSLSKMRYLKRAEADKEFKQASVQPAEQRRG